MERRGGRGGPSRGGSRGRGSSFGDRGGGGSRGRGGFSRGGRGGSMGRSESRFSRDERSDRPPFEGRGGGRGGPRGRGGFSRDFRGGGRSGDRDFRGGRMDRGGGIRGNRGGKRPASGPPQMGKRPRYEGGSSYPDANGYSAPYQSYERNPPESSSYQTQVPYSRGPGSGGYGGGDAGAYGSSGGYGSGGYMSSSGYDSAGGDYGGYSAPPPPASDHYGDSYKSKHYEGSSSGYGQSREYSSQPRSRY